jgi:hypothetical protein
LTFLTKFQPHKAAAGTPRTQVFGSAGPTMSLSMRRGIAEMGEQIAAEQRLRRLLENYACIPAMGDMWRVDIAQALAADIDDFSICQDGQRAIGDIGDGYTTADHANGELRVRRPPRTIRSSIRTRRVQSAQTSASTTV